MLLKYLSNFCRTLETSLINCEINLMLTWSANCIISEDDGGTNFAINDTKLMFLLELNKVKITTKLLQ